MQLKYGPYSPSRLDTATCGHAFYRQYIDPATKGQRFEGLAQARGSAVHEVFEQITRRMCDDQNTVFSEAEIRQWAAEASNRHPAAYQEAGEVVEMAKLYVRKPPPLLTKDAGIELRIAVKAEPNAEGGHDFVECDYDDPQALARGRADIMLISDDTTTAVVYDHKTQPNVEEADTFQMGFYAWVISKAHPYLDVIQTVLHFARYGIYSEPYVWTRDDLAKIEDELLTRIAIVESRQEWVATPNKNCQYCPYIAQCPAVAEYLEVKENGDYRVLNNNLKIFGDTSKAVKMAGLVNVLEDLLGNAKDSLKQHVKEFGAIAIPGKIFEFRASDEKVDWDVVNKKLRGKVYEVFEKHGVDARTFMSFGQTASKSVWLLENEELLKELSAIMPKTRDTTFRGYKA
jgi:CRISPR/Cas system-associated exonuclease Cas4 (RecB family)